MPTGQKLTSGVSLMPGGLIKLEKLGSWPLPYEVDLLTFKMTLNHENNIRDEFSSQNYTIFFYYTCSYFYLLKNLIVPIN